MARNRTFILDVTGRGRFPTDMLRYSSLIPADPTTVQNIEDSYTAYYARTEKSGSRYYRLRAENANEVLISHAIERFASFGFEAEVADV